MGLEAGKISNLLVMGKSGAGKQPRIDVLVREFDLDQLSTGDLFRTYLKKFEEVDFEGDLSSFYDEETDSFVPDEEILWSLGPVAKWDDPQGVVLGLKAKYFVESGKFVPDSITNEMFGTVFKSKECRGWVLDGYPRTVAQTENLLNLVVESGSNIDAVLIVEGDDDEIVARTTGRRICPNCKKVYHIEFKPPSKEGNCTHCGTPVIRRSDDSEEKIRSRLEEFHTKTELSIKFLEHQGIPIVKVPGNLSEYSREIVRKSVMDAFDAI